MVTAINGAIAGVFLGLGDKVTLRFDDENTSHKCLIKMIAHARYSIPRNMSSRCSQCTVRRRKF